MKTRILILSLAAFFALPAAAQDLNPQVQVTNDYKAELGTSGKMSVSMEIPDSLTLFRTSVSYDVFSTPYKGAYEFLPYEISVTPGKPASDISRLYLRAGAGYSFHPELDAVWSPSFMSSSTALSLFQNFRGYAGNYGALDGRSSYSGYDYHEKAGLEGKWFARDFTLDYALSYNGVFTSDFSGGNPFHDFVFDGKISSDEDAAIVYNLAARVNHAFDPVVSHTGVQASGSVYPNWVLPFDLRLDFNVESDFYGKGPYGNVFVAQISPKALYEFERISIAAGVTLSPAKDIQWVYPDVRVSAALFDDAMQVYAFVKGGQFARSYSELKFSDHWFNSDYASTMKPTLERLNAALGFRGTVLRNLQYDLNGGWASYSDAVVNTLKPDALMPSLLCSGIGYADYNMLYARLDAAWKSHRVDASVSLRYCRSDVDANDNFLDLPLLSGYADVTYNWNSRIYAGIWAEGRTECAALTYPVPGFVNLGLKGEYRFRSNFGAWAKIGNLLNHDLAYSPLHIQEGIYATLGISMNLK